MQRIITVGREFGSGGRELGRRLAEELGYDYYDKEIIQAIADKTSLSVEYVKQVVESKPHNLFPHHRSKQLFIYRQLCLSAAAVGLRGSVHHSARAGAEIALHYHRTLRGLHSLGYEAAANVHLR